MAAVTTRIRWTDAEPYGGIRGTIIGYAGGLTAEAFRIYPPSSHTRKWTLSSYYPIALGKRRYADDPDELKAEAERLLAGFVSSLGAVFADQLRETIEAVRAARAEAADKAGTYEFTNRCWGWTDALDWTLALIGGFERVAISGTIKAAVKAAGTETP